MSDVDSEAEHVHVSYDSRALVKLDRAGRLFQSLEEEIDHWNEARRLLAPARSPHDGPQRLEIFRPPELAEIPVAPWESTFHDGVHNLRVALDSLCFELCRLEGREPESPRSVHFPITAHPNEWPNAVKHLSTAPAALLERMRQCQEWARVRNDGAPDPLTLISQVDNEDKHRASGVRLDVFAMSQWAIRDSQPLPADLAEASEWPLELWMELYMTPPLPRGQAAMIPVLAWPFLMFQGLFANIADGQRWLHHETARIIGFIASGVWPDADFTQVLPGAPWSSWPRTSEDSLDAADGSTSATSN